MLPLLPRSSLIWARHDHFNAPKFAIECSTPFWVFAAQQSVHVYDGKVAFIAVSPDGKEMVSGSSNDSSVHFCKLSAGTFNHNKLDSGADVDCGAYSPDNHIVAIGQYGGIVYHSRLDDEESSVQWRWIGRRRRRGVTSIAISFDSRIIAAGYDDNLIGLWEIGTGQLWRPFLRGHRYLVSSIVFSPNEMVLAAGSVDGTVRLYDVETGGCLGMVVATHGGPVECVAFSLDGKLVASGSSDHTVFLSDVHRRKYAEHLLLHGHAEPITAVAFSPDGVTLASAAEDGLIRLWDLNSGALHGRPLKLQYGWYTCIAFLPGGKRLVAGTSRGDVQLWDWDSSEDEGLSPTRWIDGLVSFIPSTLSHRGKSTLRLKRKSKRPPSAIVQESIDIPELRVASNRMDVRSFSGWPENEGKDKDICIDEEGFLVRSQTRLLWLPPALRGDDFLSGSRFIVVGGHQGTVTVVRLKEGREWDE